MSTNVVFNNISYPIPNVGDTRWGQAVTNFLLAVGNNALSKAGGNFTLTADANFGANYGLIAKYLKSASLNIAQTGYLRLSVTDAIAFRNNANSADLPLGVNASDQMTFNGGILATALDINALSTSKLDRVGGTAINLRIGDKATFVVGATPATPAAGEVALAVESDNKFYQVDSAGNKTKLGGGGLIGVRKTANYTAVDGDMVECDTTAGSFTVTLPTGTTPFAIGILDAGPFFTSNPLDVLPGSGGAIDTGAVGDGIRFNQNRQSCVFYRANGSTVVEIQTAQLTQNQAGFTPGYTGATPIGAGYVGQVLRDDSKATTGQGIGTTNYDLVVNLALTPGVWDLKALTITTGTTSNVQTLSWITSDSTLANSPSATEFGLGAATRTLQNSAQDLNNVAPEILGLLVTAPTTYYLRVKQVGASATIKGTFVAQRRA